MILVDDWALSDYQAAASDTSPWNDLINIDSLASRGLSWSNFYAQALCNPTRATLMFGVYEGGGTGGVCNPPNASTPPANALTVAELLKARGYSTAAFGKWHIGTNPDPSGRWEDTPAAFGFDAWRAWSASNVGGHCGSTGYSNWFRVDDGDGFLTQEYHTEAVGNAVSDWWQQTVGPKFAYVCFQAPHQPLHTPPAWLLPSTYPTPTTAREKYEAMLVAMDTVIGNILAAVDPSTYVLVLGDNGTPPAAIRAGEQSGLKVKKTTFEDGVNVPFIVSGPNVPVGRTLALGHVVDIMATVAELAQADIPAGAATDSVSLVPVLRNPDAGTRDHVICDYRGVSPTGLEIRDTAVVLETATGLLKGRWFLDVSRSIDTEAYYDLAADPAEQDAVDPSDPLYANDIEILEELRVTYVSR